MTRRIVCDTNILVSAQIAGGPPSRVLEGVLAGEFELLLPVPVQAELERVLRVKFGYSAARWAELSSGLAAVAGEILPSPAGPVDAVTGDPADDIVLACAVAAGPCLLVSGDRRHLLPVVQHRGVEILTAQALLARR